MAKVKEMNLELEVKCSMCKVVYPIPVNDNDFRKWRDQGMLIQVALPYLSRAERELIISKTCDTCFTKLFGKEE